MTYYGFVYQWINVETNKKYIGSHCGSIDDGYVSSSVSFNEDYVQNPKLFKREILEYITEENQQMVRNAEQRWFDTIDNISSNPGYYNLNGKAGGWPTCIYDRRKQGLYTEKEQAVYEKMSSGEFSKQLDKTLLAEGGRKAGKIKGERIRSGKYTTNEKAQYKRRAEGKFTEKELAGFKKSAEANKKRIYPKKEFCWIITTPDGEKLKTNNLEELCKDLPVSHLTLIRHKKGKGYTCKRL